LVWRKNKYKRAPKHKHRHTRDLWVKEARHYAETSSTKWCCSSCAPLWPGSSAVAWCVSRWRLAHCASDASWSRASHWYMGCNRAGTSLAFGPRATSGPTYPQSPQSGLSFQACIHLVLSCSSNLTGYDTAKLCQFHLAESCSQIRPVQYLLR
jgi:hypothetical protein